MTKISIYEIDENVTSSDKWIGSDGNNQYRTKNFTPKKIAKYYNQDEVIDIANSLRYKYDTIDVSDIRKQGTISFETEIGPVVPISSITTFILSKTTQSGKTVSEFLNILPTTRIILQKSDSINTFGIFKILTVDVDLDEPDFFIVTLEFISGNGSMEEDLDYIISVIDLGSEDGVVPTLQEVTDAGAVTTNKIAVNVSNNLPAIIASNTTGLGLFASSDDFVVGRFNLDTASNNSNIVEFLKNGVLQSYITHNGTIVGNKSLINTTVDNGVDALQINGTASGSNATLSNQFVTKSQLDLKANLTGATFTGTIEGFNASFTTNQNYNLNSLSCGLVTGVGGGYSFTTGFGTGWLSTATIKYATDLSASYDARTLIDKGYADATYATYSNAVLLTGNQTIDGTKTFTNTSPLDKKIVVNNSSSGDGLHSNNTSTGNGILAWNLAAGNGIRVDNTSTGNGIYTYNGSSGIGNSVVNTSTGKGIDIYNASSGIGLYCSTAGTGLNYVGANNGATTFSVDKFGNTTANSFIKTGGTSSQILAADGSVITAGTNITITGGQISSVGGSGGGGSSVNYYLNGGTSQGTFGGTTYYEFSRTAVIGTGADFSIGTNGYIASFITDVADPSLLLIPAGNWNLEFFFSSSSAGGSPSFYTELYKYDGTTFTLVASSSVVPEGITGGTSIDAYFTSLAVPETVLTVNDRLAIRIFVNTSGKTITLHTQDSHLCEVITTFTSGLTALNGLQAQVQNFATGTTGTDFDIVSSGSTHTFNLPSASATARGAVTTGSQTFAGTKTFVSKIIVENYIEIGAGAKTGGLGGYLSTAVGESALGAGTTQAYNVAIGYNALLHSTTVEYATAVGMNAGAGNTTGNNGVYIGYNAGSEVGVTPGLGRAFNTYDSVFLGAKTRAGADGQTNQIVIGYDAYGAGSNTVTLGNSGITKTILRGNTLINTTTDNGVDKLQVNGTASGSAATLSNQFVTKAQLDTKITANTSTNNYIPKVSGPNTFANSRLFDDGNYLGIGTVNAPTKDITLGAQSDKVIGVEQSSNSVNGKALTVQGGRTINFVPDVGFVPTFCNIGSDYLTGITVGTDNTVYVCNYNNGNIYRQINGTGNFSYYASSGINRRMATAPNGDIYGCSNNNAVSTIYRKPLGSDIFSPITITSRSYEGITITASGDIYVSPGEGDIYKQTNSTGSFVSQGVPGLIFTYLTTAPNGDVWGSATNGNIYKQTGGTGAFNYFSNAGGFGAMWVLNNGDVYIIRGGGQIWVSAGGTSAFVNSGLTNPNGAFGGAAKHPNGSISLLATFNDIYFQNNDALGTANLAGGALKLASGTGKGTGDSNLDMYTGQKTVSGTDMQIETLRARINNEGLMTLPSVTNALIDADATGKAVTTKEWVIANSSGGSTKSINSVSTNTAAGSASSTDYFYFASGTINITLPTAVGNTNNYTIKNVGTGVITVDTTSSQTIDGSLTAPIIVQYLSLTIISDGANWNII